MAKSKAEIELQIATQQAKAALNDFTAQVNTAMRKVSKGVDGVSDKQKKSRKETKSWADSVSTLVGKYLAWQAATRGVGAAMQLVNKEMENQKRIAEEAAGKYERFADAARLAWDSFGPKLQQKFGSFDSYMSGLSKAGAHLKDPTALANLHIEALSRGQGLDQHTRIMNANRVALEAPHEIEKDGAGDLLSAAQKLMVASDNIKLFGGLQFVRDVRRFSELTDTQKVSKNIIIPATTMNQNFGTPIDVAASMIATTTTASGDNEGNIAHTGAINFMESFRQRWQDVMKKDMPAGVDPIRFMALPEYASQYGATPAHVKQFETILKGKTMRFADMTEEQRKKIEAGDFLPGDTLHQRAKLRTVYGKLITAIPGGMAGIAALPDNDPRKMHIMQGLRELDLASAEERFTATQEAFAGSQAGAADSIRRSTRAANFKQNLTAEKATRGTLQKDVPGLIRDTGLVGATVDAWFAEKSLSLGIGFGRDGKRGIEGDLRKSIDLLEQQRYDLMMKGTTDPIAKREMQRLRGSLPFMGQKYNTIPGVDRFESQRKFEELYAQNIKTFNEDLKTSLASFNDTLKDLRNQLYAMQNQEIRFDVTNEYGHTKVDHSVNAPKAIPEGESTSEENERKYGTGILPGSFEQWKNRWGRHKVLPGAG